MTVRRAYPSDVSDEEWALVAPCLTLLPEAAAQREHSLSEVFDGLRWDWDCPDLVDTESAFA